MFNKRYLNYCNFIEYAYNSVCLLYAKRDNNCKLKKRGTAPLIRGNKKYKLSKIRKEKVVNAKETDRISKHCEEF